MAEEKKNINNVEDKEMSFEERQYERLIKARNFHYENLNKWLAFFYVVIGAVFAGFCTLHDKTSSISKLEIVVITLAYIISICAYLSCKGYYYWENNWIKLLHNFEKQLSIRVLSDTRIYSVFANKKKLHQPYNFIGGANVSTTKVSLFLTFMIAIISGAILFYWITKMAGCSCPNCDIYNIFVSLIESSFVTTILTLLGMAVFKCELGGIDDLEL